MDSVLIYGASEHMRNNVIWDMVTDSEWIYCGTKGEVDKDFVLKKIKEHFTDSKLYISFSRKGSFEIHKDQIIKSIEEILGSQDFLIWDTKFKYAIELNNIGVFRRGKVK